MALATGPVSPYITPDQLQVYPTGVSWQTIPDQRSSDAQRYQAQVLLCQQATNMADTECNQLLRATQQTEQLMGPGFRVNILKSGNVRLLLSERPIISISAIQVSPSNVFPPQWSQVATGHWRVERPPLGLPGTNAAADSGSGGQAVQMGPGYISGGGHGAYVIDTTYISGWPHAGIAQAASAGDVELQVDDCTGWAPAAIGGQGCNGVIQDTAGSQEAVTCLASSVTVGPGILTLSAPLAYDHSPGVLVTSMPGQIQWATALFAASMALTRGATATTIQTLGGRSQATASGAMDLRKQACELLAAFYRVI